MINSYQPLNTNCVLIRIIYKEFITKKTYIQKIHQENNQKKKNQIIFGGMGTKVENAGTISCDFSPWGNSNTILAKTTPKKNKNQKKKKTKKKRKEGRVHFFDGVHCEREVKHKYLEDRNRLPM